MSSSCSSQNIYSTFISVKCAVCRNSLNKNEQTVERCVTPETNTQTDEVRPENFRIGQFNQSSIHRSGELPLSTLAAIIDSQACSFCSEHSDDCFLHCCSRDDYVMSDDFEPQSGVISDSNVTTRSTSTKVQNVAFSDQMSQYSYEMDTIMDPTRGDTDTGDATLDNFFSRPIKIFEKEWGTGITLGEEFNPWKNYFENPRVINRITTYNLLRANLRLKFVINGNGFHYGRALVSYLPLDALDSLSFDDPLVPATLVPQSQRPHLFLDPTTSTGGEMLCPFFWYENNLTIPNNSWDQMGRIFMRSINELKHANGATDKVTISVFAWAEDVTLSVLTTDQPANLSPQSGMETEIDEVNRTGVVSGPATAVAKAAGALKTIPAITPFMTATEMGANTVAKVAKALGYCRPTRTIDPEVFKPSAFSHLATTTVADQMQKLTVDDKQELTIDPRIAGLGPSDPLNIREIAKRESYLTTFNWNQGVDPETLLFNMRIDPVTWAEDAAADKGYYFPACAVAAMPFQYWTGTMKVRFQIVCSAFHKGRLKIVYDPNVLASNEYNTNYLQIVDIADKTDFTVEIGNGQPTTLLSRHRPGFDGVTQMYSTTPYTNKEEGNGVLGVYVVNELTTPNSTVNNDIQVNVYVSMGDDFQVFVPVDDFKNFLIRRAPTRTQGGFGPQSGSEVVPESQNTEEPSAPYQTQTDHIGPWSDPDDKLNRVFTGEAIESFRTLLHRYNEHMAFGFFDTSVSNTVLFQGRNSSFPFLRGYVDGAVHRTDADLPYNYCNTVLLHWLTWPFQGWRGSIRWKYLPRGLNNSADLYTASITRKTETQGVSHPAFVPMTVRDVTQYVSLSQAAYSSISYDDVNGVDQNHTYQVGGAGLVGTHGKVNPNVEFEFPYYSKFRFYPGKRENWTGENGLENIDYKITCRATGRTNVDALVAAGEDFQVYFYTGMPPLKFETVPPAPSVLPVELPAQAAQLETTN